MKDNINPTEKTFPRSLEQAFPTHYREQFIPIRAYKPRIDVDWIVMATCLVALGFVLGVVAMEVGR